VRCVDAVARRMTWEERISGWCVSEAVQRNI
jgi:hypothetical protein